MAAGISARDDAGATVGAQGVVCRSDLATSWRGNEPRRVVLAVRTVNPERTFWDKVVILHGLRRWFDRRGELRGGGQRVSRHYYDLHQLAATPVGAAAIANTALGADCVAHARMFFNRPHFDLAHAVPGSFALVAHDGMIDQLRADYRAMRGMIFGTATSFEACSTASIRSSRS